MVKDYRWQHRIRSSFLDFKLGSTTTTMVVTRERLFPYITQKKRSMRYKVTFIFIARPKKVYVANKCTITLFDRLVKFSGASSFNILSLLVIIINCIDFVVDYKKLYILLINNEDQNHRFKKTLWIKNQTKIKIHVLNGSKFSKKVIFEWETVVFCSFSTYW